MSKTQIFQTTPRIIMGAGALKNIVPEIKRQGCQKVFIITDPGIVSAGIAGQLEALLNEGEIAFDCFDKVEPDPRVEIAIEAAIAVKTFGADIVIGIGGGSAIDIAKISALLANNEGSLHDFFGIDLVPNPGLKTIIIPTTAGTGSEVTPIVILSDEVEKLKKGVVSPYLFPTLALLDPELTVGLPAKVTAATGMDALIHAIEAFTSKNSYGFTDMLAREAILLIAGNIRTAYANGTDMEARSKLLEGSLLAGMAFANAGVTAVHAFAYPIGAEFHIPHGVANSIMLVPVMEFNMIGNLNKFGQLADLLGQKTDNMNIREKAQAAVNALRTLTEDLEIPKSLRQFKITDSDLPMLAEGVMKVTRLLANNPRAMSVDEAEEIYRQVL